MAHGSGLASGLRQGRHELRGVDRWGMGARHLGRASVGRSFSETRHAAAHPSHSNCLTKPLLTRCCVPAPPLPHHPHAPPSAGCCQGGRPVVCAGALQAGAASRGSGYVSPRRHLSSGPSPRFTSFLSDTSCHTAHDRFAVCQPGQQCRRGRGHRPGRCCGRLRRGCSGQGGPVSKPPCGFAFACGDTVHGS